MNGFRARIGFCTCMMLGLIAGSFVDSTLLAQAKFVAPPAPALTPAAEIETFQLAAGYRAELVASDPLVQDPIAISFDPDGRIWVCEMRGFMPDIDGNGEDAPVGIISVLDDLDGDGVMDQSTVFLDGLILPRGLCWTLDGLLVCEQGTIWLCRDVDGDDRCDDKQSVCRYNPGNLEHSLNGLLPALDNWVYNAKEGLRLRRVHGQWVSEANAPRGQWGISQDNFGYLHYNVNASLLRGDLVPCYSRIAQYASPLVDAALYHEQEMFPIRPNPGINRGYLAGFLRPDGSLIEANGNCGPVVYRGDNLPADLLGNVFIPEPCGNLIRRQVVVQANGRKTSNNAYDQREFLASTDERFRPVNMVNAPDGTLYVIDMYRGVIQHGDFITPYLRDQIQQRQLAAPIHLGRIFRIAHVSTQPRARLQMTAMDGQQLVSLLSSQNGWHRDMAQQMLVQRGELGQVSTLWKLAGSGTSPLGRLHALWTLEGLNQLDPDFLFELLADEDENIRASAVTLLQRFMANETLRSAAIEELNELVEDESALVQTQILLALGLWDSKLADRAIEGFLRGCAAEEKLLEGVLSGFAQQEPEFLTARIGQEAWQEQADWREKVLSTSAGNLWRGRDPIAMLKFTHLLTTSPKIQPWHQIALLEGIKDQPLEVRRPRFAPAPGATSPASADDNLEAPLGKSRYGVRKTVMKLPTEPVGLDRLCQSSNPRLATAAEGLVAKLKWPGKNGQPLPTLSLLTEDQQRLYELGRHEYATLCAGCHHAAGYGLAAKGPPLLGSHWLEDEQRLIRVVLHGIQGPVTVNGELTNADGRLSMPGVNKVLNDEKIAGVLTYLRRDFLEDASPVDPQVVAAIRELFRLRTEPWTEAELINDVP